MTGTLTHLLRRLRGLAEAPAVRDLSDGQLLGRFRAGGEEAAFAVLLQRHGPMVLGVCRRLLGQEQDAEDAFQATFLVLARKASSIRSRDSLAGWLYGVARRIAVRTRTQAAARQARDRAVAARPGPDPGEEIGRRELRALLDEEVARLPQACRDAVVLCYLEGKTHEEAASQLGWPKSTLTSRLARAREQLRLRLEGRGLAVTGGMLTAALAEAASAPLHARLLLATVRAATADGTAAGGLPGAATGVMSLAGPGARVGRFKLLAALAFVAVLGAVVWGTFPSSPRSASPTEEQAKPPSKSDRADVDDDPLPAGAVLRLGRDRLAHRGNVSCTAFSPDGKLLASGGYDGAVRLWDPATGKELRRFQRKGWVRALVWAADGKVIISASDDDGIRFWDTATGKSLRHLPERKPRHALVKLALTSDGKTLAAGETDLGSGAPDRRDAVRLWRVGDGRELRTFSVERAYGLAFSPDGTMLAVTGGEMVRLWDVASGEQQRALKGHRGGSYAVAFSPDGALLATGGEVLDPTVRLWDVTSGREVRCLEGHEGSVYSLAFSPDGKTLASRGAGGPNRLWDVGSGKELRRYEGWAGPVAQLAFSPDGKTLVGAEEWGPVVRLWDVRTGRTISPFARHEGAVTALAFSPDGKAVLTGCSDGSLRLWDAATGAQGRRWSEYQGPVEAVAFFPDGGRFASGGNRRQLVRVWDAGTGKPALTLKLDRREVSCIAISPDGKLLAAGSSIGEMTLPGGAQMPDCAVQVWGAGSGKPLHRLPMARGRVGSIAFSPSGRILATAGPEDNVVQLWDPSTGRELFRLRSPADPRTPPGMTEGVTAIVFSRDGRSLAAVSRYRWASNLPGPTKGWENDARMVRVWEVATGAERRTLRLPRDAVRCAAFSVNGRHLFLGAEDGALLLWDLVAGRRPRRVTGHADAILAVALSRDGRTLATASRDTTALLWNAAILCARSGAGDGQ
jgi:RNA polymerase sigma factor (sigma-70 family)